MANNFDIKMVSSIIAFMLLTGTAILSLRFNLSLYVIAQFIFGILFLLNAYYFFNTVKHSVAREIVLLMIVAASIYGIAAAKSQSSALMHYFIYVEGVILAVVFTINVVIRRRTSDL